MIKTLNIDGKKSVAIIANEVNSPEGVRELRKALFEVLENSVSSDEVKNITPSLSLWYLIQLIRALEPEEKGDAA